MIQYLMKKVLLTVLKIYKGYLPLIIINKSNIHFSLHNKHVSNTHPNISIEPITNRIWVVLRKRINQNTHTTKVVLPVTYIENDENISDLVKLYVLNTLSSVVVDDTNYDIGNDLFRNTLKPFIYKSSKISKEIYCIFNN